MIYYDNSTVLGKHWMRSFFVCLFFFCKFTGRPEQTLLKRELTVSATNLTIEGSVLVQSVEGWVDVDNFYCI